MFPESTLIAITWRMVAAVLVGCVIGIDRNLRGKPTGVKTLGLVALGSALATMASMGFAVDSIATDDRTARAIQGLVTGVGFLGAGVIIQNGTEGRIRGLTTAASIWVTASLGIVCGIGAWSVALIATVLIVLLFTVGRKVEHTLHHHWLSRPDDERKAAELHEE